MSIRWFHEGVTNRATMGEVEQVLKEDGTPYKVGILIPSINNADELDIVLERLTK